MIYDKKVIQQNVFKHGKTNEVINALKQSERTYLVIRNEKEKLVKRYGLSPEVSSRILVEEGDAGSLWHINGFKSWSSFDTDFYGIREC